ncbi:hypothetical protein BDV24DRAFT_25253 [Aspergillus arachidicola]|uniref:Uncharacterized protein n=1 Tax=Aspergillus arachidicola TaxID=656916 RepID=A0A5N6YJN9_9EURO|nr:hypothetical protein BDV24DRAFT_25253 [Aspergillus arachidicola]
MRSAVQIRVGAVIFFLSVFPIPMDCITPVDPSYIVFSLLVTCFCSAPTSKLSTRSYLDVVPANIQNVPSGRDVEKNDIV